MTQIREITLSEDKKEESESPKEATEAPKEAEIPKETESKDGISARDLAAVAEAEAKAASERLKAAKEVADKKIEDEYEKIKKELKIEKAPDEYTDKRSGDVIFRRELEEPEFWLDRKDRVPPRPVLTDDEEKEISKKVEIPQDNIPKYDPQFVLSKEFGGTSNYEIGVSGMKEEAQQRLEQLKNSGASEEVISKAEEDLRKLDYLYENFHIGMNVFRTAKGGRDKVKK